MSFVHYYCPCCGKIGISLNQYSEICIFCQTQMLKTPYSEEEWKTKTIDEQEECKQYIRENIIKKNPLYNEEQYKAREYDDQHIQINSSSYTPHCPACGSPNVEKISAGNKVSKAVLFGIFSVGTLTKTYHCKNCGMKF